MARETCVRAAKEAIPTIDLFMGGKTSLTAVGASATALPATNLTGRKAILIQNLHTTQDVYLDITMPEMIVDESAHDRWRQVFLGAKFNTKYNVRWKLSGSGTNEWYAVSSAGSGTPSITQPKVLYYSTIGGGTETLATEGTAGSIAAEHGWAWGNSDTLGYNTVYVRTGGSTLAYYPGIKYDYFLTYTQVPDTSANYGYLLYRAGSAQPAALYMDLDGSVRIFAIASGATTNVKTIEFI